jgi:hypothetical protein
MFLEVLMKRIDIVVISVVWLCTAQPGPAGEYSTKRGNATLIATTRTRAKAVLQIQAELQPRNVTRIDRVYLVTPSGKKLKPTEKTTFSEQKIENAKGDKEQVELEKQKTAGTYLSNAFLFELPENEKKGRWFFYAQGAGSRGQESGFRVEIPEKDIEAATKGEPVP